MLKKIPLLIVAALFACASIASAATLQSPNLPNGIPLAIDSVQLAPYVSMTILVKAGAADETAETAGWRQLLSNAMMRATSVGKNTLEGVQLTTAAETAGGQIGAQVLDDAIAFTAAGDSSSQKELANLLINVMLHPRLSEVDFAAARRGMLRNLGAADRNAVPDHSRATEALQSLLYRGADSKPVAYGLPPEGNVDSLTGMSDDVLRGLYQKYFSSRNMIISISGDADEASLKQIFSQIPNGASTGARPEIVYATLAPSTAQTIQMNTDAPWTLLGFRIDRKINTANHDLAALRVLTAALAETAPSLLSEKLLTPQGKSKEVLAQEVSGQLQIRRDDSELLIAIQSDAAHLAASRNAALQIINDLQTKLLSPAQLSAAAIYAEGDWATTRDSSTIRAVLAGYAKVQGVFPDNQWPAQLKAVTAADVQNVAKKYLGQSAVITVNAANAGAA